MKEIYPYKEKSARNHLRNLQNSETLSKHNKELISLYLQKLDSEGSGKYRQGKLAYQLHRICEILKKDLDKTFQIDIERAISKFNEFTVMAGRKTKKQNGKNEIKVTDTKKIISEATKADYRRALKSFYLWYENYDDRLDSQDALIRTKTRKLYVSIKKIKSAYKKDKIDPSEIINTEDLHIILNKGCRSLKEKAFLSLLHETGARIGEILSMKVKHFKENEKGIGKVYFPHSKTEPRGVVIIESVGDMVRYLENHIEKDNPEAPLWYKENLRKKQDIKAAQKGVLSLRYTGAVRLVERCVKRSGLNKKCNIHWFRHSRASLDAPTLTPDVRCSRMGWSLGSKQLKNYTHISEKQVDDAFLKSKGIEINDETGKTHKKCAVCNWLVSNEKEYCPNCFRPLNISKYYEDQTKINDEIDDTIKLMTELLKKPEFAAKFEKFKEKRKRK